MFAALDSDGSGELDKAEFDTFFASHLAPLDVKEEVSLLFEMVDKFEDDGSGAWVTPEQHNNSTTTAQQQHAGLAAGRRLLLRRLHLALH